MSLGKPIWKKRFYLSISEAHADKKYQFRWSSRKDERSGTECIRDAKKGEQRRTLLKECLRPDTAPRSAIFWGCTAKGLPKYGIMLSNNEQLA